MPCTHKKVIDIFCYIFNRCYARTVTPSLFKRNQEITAIIKGYDIKIDGMTKKI